MSTQQHNRHFVVTEDKKWRGSAMELIGVSSKSNWLSKQRMWKGMYQLEEHDGFQLYVRK